MNFWSTNDGPPKQQKNEKQIVLGNKIYWK